MTGSQFHRSELRASRQHRFVPALAILLILAGVALSSVPRATLPPSSYQSGLTGTPNPMDNSSNLPITGNVLGGKHFRGNIPYNSTTSFAAPLGSTSLDSFLRYSAVPNVQPGYSQSYTPFYSSTGTVATTLPGYQGVFSPVSPRIAGGLGQTSMGQSVDSMTMMDGSEYRIAGGPRGDTSSLGVETSPRLRYVPMSMDSGQTRNDVPDASSDSLTRRPLAPAGDPLMTPQEYQQRLSQLRQDLERMQANLSQFQQNLDAANAPKTQSPPQGQETAGKPADTLAEALQSISPAQPRLELYDPSSSRQLTLPAPPVETQQTSDAFSGQGRPDAVGSGAQAALQRIEEISKRANHAAKEPSPAIEPPAREIAEPSPAKPPAEAPKKTYDKADSATQKQFDQYLAVGQSSMQQSRYDRAADSFRLASVYIPHDPRPHLGRALALLATGDCAGSAAALTRAIELDAKYVVQKLDLVETLGGPDLFVQRVSKLQERAEAGKTPQLQLLLAYIYFQTQQTDEALAAIEAVRASTPSFKASSLLDAAIRGTSEPRGRE